MSKLTLTSAALVGVLLLAGCGNSESKERENFGMMLGEIACGSMQALDGSFGDEEAQAIAEKYGFGDWTEDDLNTYVAGLEDADRTEIKTVSVDYINATCLESFEAFELAPEDMIDALLSDQ